MKRLKAERKPATFLSSEEHVRQRTPCLCRFFRACWKNCEVPRMAGVETTKAGLVLEIMRRQGPIHIGQSKASAQQ
jgi:hypothetical protein